MAIAREIRRDVLRRVGALGVWRRDGQRAPHKPLLLLLALGRASRGADRLASFAELEEPLAELLRRYGPSRRAVHPEYPFWWLRTDGLWEVPQSDTLPKRAGSGDPLRSAMRSHATGGFPVDLHEAIRANRRLVAECAQILLRGHFPSSLHAAILADVGLDADTIVLASARDVQFRHDVVEAYGHQCSMCGFDVRVGPGIDLALDAAHLKWRQAGGPDVVHNGLALCAIHHRALDAGAVTVSRDCRIVVSATVYGQTAGSRWFLRLHNRPLRPPHSISLRPDRAFLDWHAREVFRTPARD
jgi:putative restriction endonuclease